MELERIYKVLIVDTDVEIREKIGAFLREQGLEVHTMENAAQAFERLEPELYDIALIELNMEGMNGVDFTRKAIEKGIDARMLMVSDSGGRADVIAALNGGVDYWFDKSTLDLELLLEKVISFAQVIPLDEMGRLLFKFPDKD
jgi:DNA-binding response OmpR family regulator